MSLKSGENGLIGPGSNDYSRLDIKVKNLNSINMNFGQAIEALKEGKRVARNGWNGKGMYLFLVSADALEKATHCYGEMVGEPATVSSIAMKTADNKIVIGWLASQTDILSEDWGIL